MRLNITYVKYHECHLLCLIINVLFFRSIKIKNVLLRHAGKLMDITEAQSANLDSESFA